MTKAELSAIIRDGETSRVAFATADIVPEVLAAEVCGLLNCDGGHVLLGVAGDSSVTGLCREPEDAREQVMEAVRRHVEPAIVPIWDAVRWQTGKAVGIVTLRRHAPGKPYKANLDGAWATLVRVGTTTWQASRLEEERLYQQSGIGALEVGTKAVAGATLADLDIRRLRDYFSDIRIAEPSVSDGAGRWDRVLADTAFAAEAAGRTVPTAIGMILFGNDPGRFLEGAGIRAICHIGEGLTGTGGSSAVLSSPLVPLRAEDGSVVQGGLVDAAWDFVCRSVGPGVRRDGARWSGERMYPEAAVREAVTNALVHRNYSIAGDGVMLGIFDDRLEIRSLGCLPDTITTSRMRKGIRYQRNPILANVMREYGYASGSGLGVRRRIVPEMRQHDGTAPDLIEGDGCFTVGLWNSRRRARSGRIVSTRTATSLGAVAR